MRAWSFAASRGPLLEKHRDKMKDTVIWNTEAGLRLTGDDLSRAEIRRAELYHRVRKYMETYEFMVFPVSQVPPFPIEQRYISEIDGVAMETYIDWMRSCYYITVTGHPTISVPCGFTPDGLPVGIQIVGRHRDDFGVLQIARAFEQATEIGLRRPAVALES